MIPMSKGLNEFNHTNRFMATDMYLRELFGPIKGDHLTWDEQEFIIEKCYMVPSLTAMMDYSITARNSATSLSLRVPVEDMTNNGWSWHVGKFPFELQIEEVAGMFHVVDPIYQNTFDVRATDEAHAVAKAQCLFQSDAQYFLVHKMYSVKALPSAAKMLAQFNRAVKSIPYGRGPLSGSVNHPDPIDSTCRTEKELNCLQKALEVAFAEYASIQTWSTLGDGKPYSTEDFQIIQCSAETDGGV